MRFLTTLALAFLIALAGLAPTNSLAGQQNRSLVGWWHANPSPGWNVGPGPNGEALDPGTNCGACQWNSCNPPMQRCPWNGGFLTITDPNIRNCDSDEGQGPSCQVLRTFSLCSPGFTLSSGVCVPVANAEDPGKTNGKPCPSCGNPVSPANGNKFETAVDYLASGPFPLRWTRTYNSRSPFVYGSMGRRWLGPYDSFITESTSGGITTAIVTRPDGKSFAFSVSSGVGTPDSDITDTLERTSSPTGWKYTETATGEVWIYETTEQYSRVKSVENRQGIKLSLNYGADNLLTSIQDPFGKQLSFAYDTQRRLTTITIPSGGTIAYTYGTEDVLLTVTYPDSRVLTYVYNESSHTSGTDQPQALTGIIDEKSVRFATFDYDSQGRVVSSQHAGGANLTTLSYSSGTTRVTEWITGSTNAARDYAFSTALGAIRNTSITPVITGDYCPSCGPQSMTYDANNNVTSRIDWNGNRTNYTYDTTRNLETSRTEGLDSSGGTTAVTRTIATVWHSTFQLPAVIAEPLRITTFTYNGDGSTTCGTISGSTLVPGVLCTKSEQATTDTDGSQGIKATTVGNPREWKYTYNPNGLPLTVKGPRTDITDDITTYAYYTNNPTCPTTATGSTAAGCGGQLASVTNALNQTTLVDGYNANGQPVSVTDPNGLVTAFAYDARQRLTSRNVGGEITSYGYDYTGQLTTLTLPDSSYLGFTYDDAHRLTAIALTSSDGKLSDKIAYTLDLLGNRTLEQVKDSSNTVVQTKSRVFSTISRLLQEIGASKQTTAFAYDAQGNVTSVTDPLSLVTSSQFDQLNRFKQVTDPASGVTAFASNGLDALVQVTDPRTLATTYTINGLGNLTLQQSPDTGSTTNTFDDAGNLLTSTDAKSQQTTFVYDKLNRVTSITFSDGSKQEFVYDLGTNGLGRLTSITEKNASNVTVSLTEYGYDQKGRVTSDARTVNSIPYTTGYSYDSFGRLSGLSYPVTGRTVSYSFDGLGRINQITTTKSAVTQTILSSGVYQPFGVAKGWTMGNSQAYSRTVDQDGRISSYTLGSSTIGIGFDDASRITCISPSTCPSATPTIISTSTDAYTYDTASNRIATLTPAGSSTRNFTLDANGSTTSDGVNSFAYDKKGRMSQSTAGSVATTYQVNALGQRIRKSNSIEDTVYLYDKEGRLIAEGTAAGAIAKEYVYLNDIPVAVIVGQTIYYIHPDHLNTPRLVSDQAQQWAWRWGQTDPFGNSAPDSQSRITLNLRFPGQYSDAETGLNYNYFRDYQSAIGRYIQSDPIGLAGGLNTYVYVKGNPLRYRDPLGLTERDIQVAWKMVRGTQTDLNFFGFNSPTTAEPPRGWIGSDNPKGWVQVDTNMIAVHPKYLKDLDNAEATELIQTIIHEVLHPNYPYDLSEWSIEQEARIRAHPLLEGFHRARRQICQP